MSLLYEAAGNLPHNPEETSEETHELVAWFSDPDKLVSTNMPALSTLTRQRLNGLLGDDHEFGFMAVMTNLLEIEDPEKQQTAYLYMCGYSEADLNLMTPDVSVAEVASIVDSWRESNKIAEVPVVENDRKFSVHTHRQLGSTAADAVNIKPKQAKRKPRTVKDDKLSTKHVSDGTPMSELIRADIELDNVIREADFGKWNGKNGESKVVSSAHADLDATVGEQDLVRQYLNEAGKIKLLTAEQEVGLAKRIEAGMYAERLVAASRNREYSEGIAPRELSIEEARDLKLVIRQGERAKQHLLEANLRWVINLAKRYKPSGMPYLDLIQEGNLGLIHAMEKFDYQKGFKFSTYSAWWIRQAITRGLGDQNRTIRLPVHMVEKINKLSRLKREMTQDLGRDVTDEELAAESGIPVEKINDLFSHARDPVSLDMPVGTDEEAPLGDFLDDEQTPTPADMIIMAEMIDQVRKVIETLDEREQEVVRERFGLNDGVPKTLDQIGKPLGLSRERVRQIESQVMSKLRTGSRARSLRDFAN